VNGLWFRVRICRKWVRNSIVHFTDRNPPSKKDVGALEG
jgi:hypothetical protein